MADKPKKPEDHGGGSSDNFWPIIIGMILVALALNKTQWGHNLIVGNATSTASTVGLSRTYSDSEWGITFSYPSSWQVKKVAYRTPAEEARGERATVVQVDIVSPSKAVISMGGRQTECSDFAGTQTSCRTVLDTPVYTAAKDADSRAAFDLITSTMHERK